MKKLLALIIEDDLVQAQYFSKAIKAAGFQTQTVYDGLTALRQLSLLKPNLVVLDLHLPGAPGQKILDKIRMDRRLRNICVILATADAVQAKHLASKADLILLKPISFIQLRDLAQQLYFHDTQCNTI